MKACGRSDVGRVRANNEDAFAVVTERGLFVVADGMGGAAAGERASEIAVNTLVQEVRFAEGAVRCDLLRDAVELANRAILREAECDPALTGMGTTVTAALLDADQVCVINAGDSRTYRFRNGALHCITTDHTWVQQFAKDADPEALRHHPYRHVLTKAVGADEVVHPDCVQSDFLPGDILLLCSDGLHGVLEDQEIASVLAEPSTAEDLATRLIEATLERGAPDNVTVVLVVNAPTSEDA